MIQRRTLVGGAGASLLSGFSSCSMAAKEKDPCRRAKSLPSPLVDARTWLTSAKSGIGGSYRSADEAIFAVHLGFQATIESNFAVLTGGDKNRLLGKLNDRELTILWHIYSDVSLNSGRAPLLLDIIVPALDARQIARIVAVAGFERVYSVALRLSPVQAQTVLDAAYSSGSSGTLGGLVSAAGFNENPLDYTIKEIYLSYRTAPKGSFSVPAAMYETATFAGTRLLGAFGLGYTLGTAMQKTWAYFGPDSWNAFSDFIGPKIDSFVNSVGSIIGTTPYSSVPLQSDLKIGSLEEGFWSDFESPGNRVWFSSGGDFGVTSSWSKWGDASCK